MWRIKWNVKRFWGGDLDLNNVDLADLTGIRPSTIGAIMKNACDYITLEDLAKICQALHRNIDEILLLIKDTDDLEGEERDKAILKEVGRVRAERTVINAEKRAKKEAAKRIEEEQRIQSAIKKALIEFGIIDMPAAKNSLPDHGSGEDNC